MRIWFSGPRILGGLVRPGISLGKEDFRSGRKVAMAANAVLGLFRRSDGAILMAIGDKTGSPIQNADADAMPDMTPVAAFAFASMPAAIEVREGSESKWISEGRTCPSGFYGERRGCGNGNPTEDDPMTDKEDCQGDEGIYGDR